MYKLKVDLREERQVVSFKDMKIGQIGKVITPTYKDEIVIKSYDNVVSLSNPKHNWMHVLADNAAHQVELLFPGESVTITV